MSVSNHSRRASIATQLLAVFLVATGLTAAMIAINVRSEYTQAQNNGAREVVHEAGTQAHDLAGYYSSQLLTSLKAVAEQPGISQAAAGHCTAAVKSLSALISGGGVALLRPDGRVLCQAGTFQPVARSAWFLAAVRAGWGFGGPLTNPRTHKPMLGYAYKLTTNVGPSVLVLEQDSAASMLSTGPTHLEVYVASHRSGLILDSLPKGAYAGRTLPTSLRSIAARRSVTAKGPTGSTGIFASSPVAGTDWFVVTGLPRSRALASATQSLHRNLLLGGLMLVVLLGLGVLVNRRIAQPARRLRRAIDTLATTDALDGEPLQVPDNAPRELAELGHALVDLVDARRRTEQRLVSLVRHASDLVFIVDAHGAITYATPSVDALLSLSEEAVIGRRFLELVHPKDRQRAAYQFGRTEDNERNDSCRRVELTLVAGDVVRDVEWRTQRLVDDPAIAGTVVTCHDITDRKRAELDLAHSAMHDSLTGLPNRALALDRLQHLLARTGRNGTISAVLFVDLDRFKLVNDSTGHAAGDELLVQVATRLSAVTRPGDTLSRFGGDEFVVVCESLASPEDAVQVAMRVLDGMQAPFEVSGQEMFVTASIGIAIAEPGDDAGDLLRDADAAMYRAKDQGRSGWVMFDDGMRADVQRRLDVGNKLRRALSGPGLFLEFQPVLALDTRRAVGVEALVRWQDGNGVVRPDEFIPVAEETGLIIPIGEWVLRESCRQLVGWREGERCSPEQRVSVNVSARQLAQPDFADVVARALGDTGLDPRLLVLEVTESVLMLNHEAAADVLTRLRALGVSISIDDFGTGYSSLGYLQKLPIDELKIDRSFVATLGSRERTTPILDAIVGLAHAVGLTVVAEGVETETQAGLLTDMGCDLAQGFHFARPLRADAALGYLVTSGPLVPSQRVG